ncbi:MAG: hypothetical protein AABY65_07610 [Nitrospirota bacterium]
MRRDIYQFINVPLGLGERGGSIIAAVFLIVVIGFLGAIVVSLVSTQSFQSVGELNSTQAFYAADGGIERGMRYVASNEDGTPSWSDNAGITGIELPNLASVDLGTGTFTLTSRYPTTVLRTALPAKVGGPVVVTLDVATALDFPTAGIRIEVGTEAIDCTGKNEATRQLTGCTRPGGNQPAHPVGEVVRPVTRTNGVVNDTQTTINVDNTWPNDKFLDIGVIMIDSEQIFCRVKTTTSFSNCQRGFNGTTAANHGNNQPVYPYTNQATLVSTGNRATLLSGVAQRVVQVTIFQ